MKKTKSLQGTESIDYYPIHETTTVEGMIKLTMDTREKLDSLIDGFIEDGWTRDRCLEWFRSFGLYYSRLPER